MALKICKNIPAHDPLKPKKRENKTYPKTLASDLRAVVKDTLPEEQGHLGRNSLLLQAVEHGLGAVVIDGGVDYQDVEELGQGLAHQGLEHQKPLRP